MTYESDREQRKSTVKAVTISAVTTLIGAGVLLFARHPALFSIGLTLVIGVAAGYISSIAVIPSFQRLMSHEQS
jgi:predicted RND superfamily exporter protein